MYDIQLQLIPRIDAQRKVTQFIALTLGTQLLGGEPEDPPIEVGEGVFWGVPVLLKIPPRGVVGQVGEILVNAYSGELKIEDDTLQSITSNAERLYQG
jgi:hypothetical protein